MAWKVCAFQPQFFAPGPVIRKSIGQDDYLDALKSIKKKLFLKLIRDFLGNHICKIFTSVHVFQIFLLGGFSSTTVLDFSVRIRILYIMPTRPSISPFINYFVDWVKNSLLGSLFSRSVKLCFFYPKEALLDIIVLKLLFKS